MYRKIEAELLKWKQSNIRKPLILQGARQIGKTYSVLMFGRKYYDHVVYINFETNPSYCELFSGSIHPDDLIPLLSYAAKTDIQSERTLLVFDEVQLCERALTSLKYFCENARDYHVIAVGSLLGVALNRSIYSFPVGKVDALNMYPLDFEEFLCAVNETELIERISKAYQNQEPLHLIYHEQALKLFYRYLATGGMPACVQIYKNIGDDLILRMTQDQILSDYLNDMSKYNKNGETRKTRLVYENLFVQLSKPNTRFQYKLVKKGGRAAEFENAIEWLCLSGIASKINGLSQLKKPLHNYQNPDQFKLYGSDCGLLCAKSKVSIEDLLYESPAISEFRGGLCENYVFNQLQMKNYELYFYQENNLEIDFILVKDNQMIPIEVKSSRHTESKSLNAFMRKHQTGAIRISTKNFGFENGIASVPLYAVFCL